VHCFPLSCFTINNISKEVLNPMSFKYCFTRLIEQSIYFRHPCTTTEMTRIGLMAVGYGCGTIRIFDPTVKLMNGDAEDQLPMIVQMSAHARCVTSMSAARDADLLLSVSEDSWIRVWKINSTVITINI